MVISAHGTLEYIEETTFADFPTNPAMQAIGIIMKGIFKPYNKNEDYRGLKAAGATNKLQIAGNIKTGSRIELDLEYKPLDWTFLKYAMNDDPATKTGLTDILKSLSFGLISTDATPKYTKFSGGMVDEIQVELAEDQIAKVTVKIQIAHVPLIANNPWSLTDYKGTGSHATITGTPFAWSNITTLTLGGISFLATNIKFGIKNYLKEVPDGNSSNSTKIVSYVPQKRDISLSATVRRSAIDDFAVKAFGYGANDIVLTVGGKTFTFTGAKIPSDEYNFAEEGLSEMSIDFKGITNLTIV